MPYHTVPAESLAKRTVQRLVECGIPRAALGRVAGKRVTLTGCVSLTSQAYATLPPALGGSADIFRISHTTSTLLERAIARTPLRGESLGLRAAPSTPFRTPSAPGRSSPRNDEPSSADRIRAHRAALDHAEATAEAERAELAAATALRAQEAELAARRRASLRSNSGGAGGPTLVAGARPTQLAPSPFPY